MMTFEESLEVITESFDLELARANRDFNYAYGMVMVEGTMPTFSYSINEAGEEGNTEKKSGGLLTRMIDAIVKFFQDLNNAISNAFKADTNVDVESYMNSMTGQVKLAYDMEAVQRHVDKQLLQGRKLIQAISSTTGVSDETVAKFCDSCTNIATEFGGPIVKMAAVSKIRDYVANSCLKKADQKVSALRGCETWDQKQARREAQAQTDKAIKDYDKKMKRAQFMAKHQNIAKVDAQKQRVINAMAGMCKEAGNCKKKVFAQVNGIYNQAKAKVTKKGATA